MIGFDLDGVFVNDVHTPALLSGELSLQEMLNARKNVVPLFTLFNLSCKVGAKPIFLISARPALDRQDTDLWLQQHFPEYGGLNLVLRESNDLADDETAAQFKASTIAKFGITKYVESSYTQAIRIAQLQPNCKVIHFSSFLERALIEALT